MFCADTNSISNTFSRSVSDFFLWSVSTSTRLPPSSSRTVGARSTVHGPPWSYSRHSCPETVYASTRISPTLSRHRRLFWLCARIRLVAYMAQVFDMSTMVSSPSAFLRVDINGCKSLAWLLPFCFPHSPVFTQSSWRATQTAVSITRFHSTTHTNNRVSRACRLVRITITCPDCPQILHFQLDPAVDRQPLTRLTNFSDLDIYGVLVVIAVATLAMPLTLRFSRTYFNTPGRNLVFLCALLNLAGQCLPLVVNSSSLPHFFVQV